MLKIACALVAATGLAVSASAVTVTLKPLLMAGDALGPGNVQNGFSSVADFALGNDGTWLIETAISSVSGSLDIVVKGTLPSTSGAIIASDGGPVPGGPVFSSFGRMSMNNSGAVGFNAFYASAGAADSGIHYNVDTQVILETSLTTAPQYVSPGPYTGFFGGLVNDQNQMLVMASVDDPALSGVANRALIRVDNPTGAATQTALLKAGDEVVQGRLLVDFQTNPHTYTFASGGRVLCIPDMDGDGLTDSGLLYYNGSAWSFVAREGDPCPAVPGRNWGNFGTTPCDINNSGAWAVRATLDNSSTANDSVIIRNGVDVLAREGSPVHGVTGFNFTGFGTGAVKIDDQGNVFYYGAWTDAGTPVTDSGLFRNGELIVRSGVTTTTTNEVVNDIAGVQDNFTISDNGRFLVFEGDLFDPFVNSTRRGTILVEIGGCLADFNASGSVTVQDIFDFLAAYFTGAPGADINGVGGVTVQDIFDYLAAYFAGCP